MRTLLTAALVAVITILTAAPAHALRDCRLRKFVTEAELLARADADCTVGYALDTDTFFVRAESSWRPVVGDSAIETITTTKTLDADDCGKTFFVTAGIDTKSITLPATVASCSYTFIYNGADDGALVDISPAAADGIHGTCTLAASALEFSGTDDADIGITKATANTGDRITLVGDGSVGWYVADCAGIWANN